MAGSREEERRKLADIINHWNANRLDLFEISRPTEVGETPPEELRQAEVPAGPGLSLVISLRLSPGSWECFRADCCGKRGLLGLLGVKSSGTCMELLDQTPLKNLTFFQVVTRTFYLLIITHSFNSHSL